LLHMVPGNSGLSLSVVQEKRKIIVNPEIIKAPSKCIEYVFIHELCHIKHPHHGKEFYSLQEKMMPDWKRWKDRLERVMI